MKLTTTAVVLSLSPGASFFLASQFRCRGYFVQPWTAVILSATTGAAAYHIGNAGDTDAIALMYTLNFMLGSAWLLTSRYCSRLTRAAHAAVLLVVVSSLMHRVQKSFAFYSLIPLLAQSIYLVVTTGIDALHLVDKSLIY